MFDKKYKYFLFNLVITMSFVDLLIVENKKFLFFDLLFILGSLFVCLELNDKKSFYRVNMKKKFLKTFLWGDYYSDVTDQDVLKEEDLFQKMKLSTKLKRFALSFLAFSVSSSISVSFFGIEYVPFIIVIPLIISSTYVGHLFFIGLLKISMTIGYVGLNGGAILSYYILSFIFIHFIYSFKSIDPSTKISGVFRAILPFLIIFSALQYLLPENREQTLAEIVKLTPIPKKNKKTKVIKIKNLTSAQTSLLKSKGTSFSSEIDKLIGSIDKFEDLALQLPQAQMSLIKSDSQKIKIELEQTKDELDSLLSKKEITQEDINKISELIKKIEQLNKNASKLNSDIQSLSSKLDKPGRGGVFKELDEQEKNQSLETLEFKELVEKIKTPENGANKDNSIKPRVEINGNKSDEKSNQWVKAFLLISKSILTIIIFWILRGLYLRFKKEDEGLLSKEEKISIKKKINQIRHLKLSPNEEIIASYNVFKDIVKDRDYVLEEVPPPRVLSQLSSKDKVLSGVTDIFCSCFYGDFIAKKSDLSTFRKLFRKIIT